MKNLKILTDESCNFNFYENCWCEKIYETIVKNQEYGKVENISSERAFIYKKRLQEEINEVICNQTWIDKVQC